MTKKNVYIFLFNGFSDWEISYLTPELEKNEKIELDVVITELKITKTNLKTAINGNDKINEIITSDNNTIDSTLDELNTELNLLNNEKAGVDGKLETLNIQLMVKIVLTIAAD